MGLKLFILSLLFVHQVSGQSQIRSSTVLITDPNTKMSYLLSRRGDTLLAFNMNGAGKVILLDSLQVNQLIGQNNTTIDSFVMSSRGRFYQVARGSINWDWTQVLNKPSFFDGNYNNLTNKPSRTPSNTARSFNSAFQVSTTRDGTVQYTVTISASLTIGVGQTGTVFLETSPNNSTWTLQDQFTNGNTGTLAVGFALTQTVTQTIRAYVPAGYYVRLRTTGTATITYVTSQELLL